MYPPRKPFMRDIPFHTRVLRALPASAYIHSAILYMRRLRRVSRPIFPIAIRLILVLLTITHFFPAPLTLSSLSTPPSTLTSFQTSSKMSTIVPTASASSSPDPSNVPSSAPNANPTAPATTPAPSCSASPCAPPPYIDHIDHPGLANADHANADHANADHANADHSNVNHANSDHPPSVDSTNVDSSNVDSTNVDSTNVDSTNVDSTNVDQANGSILGFSSSILSRLIVICGTILLFMSVIFFDTPAFNLLSVLMLVVHTMLTSVPSSLGSALSHICSLCYVCTPILFSMLVGRRRSISKPSAIRSNKRSFLATLPHSVRHVDLLDFAIRLQVSLLLVDCGSFPLFVSVPIAIAFSLGYAIHKLGLFVIMLVVWSAFTSTSVPLVTLSSSTIAATITATFLAIVVGPGHLTVDEWLAMSTQQLCY